MLFVIYRVVLYVLVCFLCFVRVGVCGLKASMCSGCGSLGDDVCYVFLLRVRVGVCICVLYVHIYMYMNVWVCLRCVV